MKKALSILLALTLALSLAVTALADEDTAPPTGDNVVKLTCYSAQDDWSDAEFYLVFSQLTKAVPTESDGMEYHIPVGSMVTVYWYYSWYYIDEFGELHPDGEFMNLDPDESGVALYFFDGDKFAEETDNDDGTLTYTFNETGTYEFDAMAGVDPWRLSPDPLIVVEGAASDTPSTPVELPADVPADAWFAASAELALKHGLVSADNGKYDPDATQSLSNVAAALKALDPDSTVELYTGADRIATRADMVVMFWKHAGSPESTCSLAAFPDAGEVKNAAAWAWAVEKGLIYGTEKGLEPAATLPKSHLAQLAVRYMDILSK